MMHAKTMISDDRIALVGTINLEPLSLTKQEEGAVVIDDPEVVRKLEADLIADFARGKVLTAK